MEKMRFIIIGATGMAGHMLSLYLDGRGHEVVTFSRQPFPVGRNMLGDAGNLDGIKELMRDYPQATVVNCIGVLNQACDRDPARAVLLNSFLPHFIARAAREFDSRLIQISTDCVFSGKKGRYGEHDLRDGETMYDRTKALGEIEDDRNLTFRNSIIGPDMKVDGIGLFNWFMKQSGPIQGYVKAIWNGVSTLTLAKAVEKAAAVNLTGLYHLVNPEPIDKYHLLLLFNQYLKHGAIQIEANDAVAVDKSLCNNRLDFDFLVPSYDAMIREIEEWVAGHPAWYPHYGLRRQHA